MKKIMVITICAVLVIVAAVFIILHFTDNTSSKLAPAKPVVYLYPKETTDVSINIDFDGTLLCTYPSYNNGWNVIAFPDGKIIDKTDGAEYSYLFWEGTSNKVFSINEGFVVPGDETETFLKEKLSYMGLLPKEYNEFIVYWLPRMQHNKYNMISFVGDEYTDMAKLNVSPQPDSMLRVFMVYKSVDEKIEINKQELKQFNRKGFSVIEWGGCEIE